MAYQDLLNYVPQGRTYSGGGAGGVDPASIKQAWDAGDITGLNRMLAYTGMSGAGATTGLGLSPQDLAFAQSKGVNFAASGSPQENTGWNTLATGVGSGSPQVTPAPSAPGGPSTPDGSYGGGNYGKYTPNRYLGDMQSALTNQSNHNVEKMLAGIKTNSVMSGGIGGSRQGVAEGTAIGNAQMGLDSSIAGMNFNDYNGFQNRDLQRYGMDQNMYTQQRGQDLQEIGLGSQLYGQSVNGAWDPLKNAGGIYGGAAGFGGTTTQNQSGGGGALGFLGGALGAGQLATNAGWFGNNSGTGQKTTGWW